MFVEMPREERDEHTRKNLVHHMALCDANHSVHLQSKLDLNPNSAAALNTNKRDSFIDRNWLSNWIPNGFICRALYGGCAGDSQV